METSHSAEGAIRFGMFEADFRAGELRKQGIKVKLQDQPFEVLQVLLQHPGEVVTREELRAKIWPSDTFVDFDVGINNAIKRLREALGDSAETPGFIETLPRHGYRFIGTTSASPRKFGSLAVLPLENLSRDPEQEYFAEGLTEALITTLAKIGELRVVSRTSAMQYQGVRKPLPEIARELGVEAIVEGTVLRAGDRVRITAQLIDAARELHLWAESYERDLRDVLSLQSEVAEAIAREVRVKLTPQEQTHLAQVHPVDPEAYESYLKGRYYWNRRSVPGLAKAVQYFRRAIEEDTTYAAAYSGLADCLSVLGLYGVISPDESCGKAKSLALHALAMDHSLAEAYTSLAFATLFYDYDFVAAEKGFERSIELNPRYATAHSWFGYYLAAMGRHEEGYTEAKRAIRLDPLSSPFHFVLGIVYWHARRYEQAIEQLEKAYDLDSDNALAQSVLGYAYLCKARYEPAITALQKAVQLSQGATTFIASLGEAYAAAGYQDEAQKILEQLTKLSKQRYVMSYPVARIYTALGKRDEALRWLETAYGEHAALMVFLKTDPRLDDLRGDPRFEDLLGRMNFP